MVGSNRGPPLLLCRASCPLPPSRLHWLHKRTTGLIFQFLGSLRNCQTRIGPRQHVSTHSTVDLHRLFDHWRCCEPFPNGQEFRIRRFQTNPQTDSLPSGFRSSIRPKACARFYDDCQPGSTPRDRCRTKSFEPVCQEISQPFRFLLVLLLSVTTRRSGQVDQDLYLVAVHQTTEPIEKAKTTGGRARLVFWLCPKYW